MWISTKNGRPGEVFFSVVDMWSHQYAIQWKLPKLIFEDIFNVWMIFLSVDTIQDSNLKTINFHSGDETIVLVLVH